MAIPFDLTDKPYCVPMEVLGATPDGDDKWLWVPGHNGRILGGWAAYESKPTSGTVSVTVEIGTTDALTWEFTSSDTDYRYKAGTIATGTALLFDTDDVVHLDVSSTNSSEATLSVWLLVQGR